MREIRHSLIVAKLSIWIYTIIEKSVRQHIYLRAVDIRYMVGIDHGRLNIGMPHPCLDISNGDPRSNSKSPEGMSEIMKLTFLPELSQESLIG